MHAEMQSAFYRVTQIESQIHSSACRARPSEFRKFPAENFRKFILIFPKISGYLLITYVNQLFPNPALQNDAVK